MSQKKKGSPVAGVLGLVVFIVIVIVAFNSCGSHTDTSSPSTPSSTGNPPSSAAATVDRSNPDVQDALYIGVLDENRVPYTSRDGAIHLAHMICSDLDAGTSVTDLELKLLSANSDMQAFTAAQLGTIVGSAVSAYCPAHRPELDH